MVDTGTSTTLRAIMISSPKLKNHCEGHVTTQERRLFVLWGCHCWTSTEVDALMVDEAFYKFGRRWYTWGTIILKEYKRDCYAVWLLQEPMLRRKLAPPSSRLQESVN
jgi:hypothetical protein